MIRHRLHRRSSTHIAAGAALALVAVLASACGSSHGAAPNSYVAGQVPKSALPSGASQGGSNSTTTIPLAKQNTVTALFTALSTFQSCLQGMGVTFIGAPTANNPNAPQNNPSYIKSLTTCAAQSNILQALKNAQTAQDNLTLAQIHTENKEYLKWRTCMIGKGWGIPQPTPNAQGLLFSFGGTGSGSVPDFTPPAGQTLLSSGDMQACASQAIG